MYLAFLCRFKNSTGVLEKPDNDSFALVFSPPYWRLNNFYVALLQETQFAKTVLSMNIYDETKSLNSMVVTNKIFKYNFLNLVYGTSFVSCTPLNSLSIISPLNSYLNYEVLFQTLCTNCIIKLAAQFFLYY